ncbi:hypothetical protein PAXRUDRAFT_168675 [Paxillus rubicundulus Ve08.2h10]|uniref:Uncharacterized protein n=1 Tax=Paxillus rubicundulus Ve08.2h10 TaxID=930991 RepID=A0A0D0DG45_9AGAM|nr:hypothetical protein PAXRUDRAFT_168675 [Paxillus rubicundulus Ve08.2h10]
MTVLVAAKFPSVAAVLMACIASVLLLVLARIVFALMRLSSCPMSRPEGQEKESRLVSLSTFSFSGPWSHSLNWNTLPVSLPFILCVPEKPSPEAGNVVDVGLSPKRPETLPVANWYSRCPGPQFQPPPPALYENPVPLSMAKIIMSRHTFRRPNPNRPRRTSIASSQPTSPQSPSRLYHSIA